MEHLQYKGGVNRGNPVTRTSTAVQETAHALLEQAKQAQAGPYDGIYRVEGWYLERADGGKLAVAFTPRAPGPRESERFLLDVAKPGRPRIGYLYGGGASLDGGEFDDGPRGWRYRIERVDAEHVRIRTLYRKRQKGGRR